MIAEKLNQTPPYGQSFAYIWYPVVFLMCYLRLEKSDEKKMKKTDTYSYFQ